MTKELRHEFITQQLTTRDSISVIELSHLLSVSPVTIRKDLAELEQEGKLYRSHGCAKPINPFTNNRPVNEKEVLFVEEKRRIGIKAASFITERDSIIIASGTTVHAFARAIRPIERLSVVSASLPVTLTLSADHNIDIIQLGGWLRHSSLSTVGEFSESVLDHLTFSKLYLGVDGIDFEYGITTTDIREAQLNRKMMRAAEKTIVVADSSKFGRRGFAKIADLEEVDLIITDSNIPEGARHKLEERGIEVLVAE